MTPPLGSARAGLVSQVGDAIPDSEDLQARYDATELALSNGNSVTTWPDETGNGHDLTAGTAPTYRASVINGNPVVEFDGVDDFLDVAFAEQSQPNQIFAVFQFISGTSNNTNVYDGESSQQLFGSSGSGEWRIRSGISAVGGNADTEPHISNALFNSPNSNLRVDGGSINLNSSDTGDNGLDGFTVGSSASQTEYANVYVGEILIYPQDKTDVQSDVESYLSDKWGITL